MRRLLLFLLFPLCASAQITIAGTPQKASASPGATSLVLNLPLGGTTVSANTFCSINTGTRAGTPGVNTPAGWTLLATATIDANDNAQVFYENLSSGSAQSASVTLNSTNAGGATNWAALAICYQGYNFSSPFDGSAVAGATAAGSTTDVAASYTTSLANSVVVWAYYYIGDEGVSAPTYTQGTEEIKADRNFTSANDFSSFVDKLFSSSGATGTNTMTTANGSAFGSTVITFALAVAPSGPTGTVMAGPAKMAGPAVRHP